mmetsp:Transcript_9422/g.21543  ORF Transcript_9422/g.21543 Transcript_9422/m.21543 type:complete len:323 (+) Transcript_9422:31-999(+)
MASHSLAMKVARSVLARPIISRTAAVCRADLIRNNCSRTLASAAADAPLFDADVTALYVKIFNQMRPTWQRHIDAMNRHAASPPATVLDIASGPGQPAAMIAETFKSARVLSSDFSPVMVEQAKKLSTDLGLKNMECEVLDMTDMVNIPSNSIDVCTASFGYMFASDLGKALEETYRVLRPGGLLTATMWIEMPMIPVAATIMEEVLGHAPPPPRINPLSLKQVSSFAVPLKKAGFEQLSSDENIVNFDFGTDPDFSWRIGTVTILSKLKELAADGKHGDVMATAKKIFARETATWTNPATSRLVSPDAVYRLVVAKKPEAE